MPPSKHPAPSCTPATLREIATGFQASRILLTAIELRVFSLIGDSAVSSGDVAARVGGEPRATDRLLNALCALRLLDKDAGRFANTAEGRRFLCDDSPEYMAGLRHTASMWQSWHGLTDAVRQGAPVARGAINDRGDAWLEPFIAAMHYRAAQQAGPLAALLPLDGVRRALDVGGGSGAFAMAIARQAPDVTAVVFDLPNVVPITRGYIESAGLTARVATATGDYLADPLPQGFDLVLLSAVVHSNSPAQNAVLVGKCAAALNPGGAVAILDWVMAPDRTSPAAGAFFALNMLVATDAGDTFTEAEIAGWLSAAGLSGITRVPTPFGTDLMLGRRA